MPLLLLLFLVLLVVAALPQWPYSRRWGYVPSSGLGLLLIILLFLLFFY
jgi:hypothetical protein